MTDGISYSRLREIGHAIASPSWPEMLRARLVQMGNGSALAASIGRLGIGGNPITNPQLYAASTANELRDIERSTFFLERRSDNQASTYLDIERHLQQAGQKEDGSLGSQAYACKHRSQYERDLRWQASQAGCFAFVAMVVSQLRWRRTIQTAYDETQTDDVQPVQPEILTQTDDVQPVQPEI